MRKKIIFIPYQDSDDYYSNGILTREYSILYMLFEMGCNKLINIKKPRTSLDKKKYRISNEMFPEGTIENQIKGILDQSVTIQYLLPFSFKQIKERRNWWISGYLYTINLLEKLNINYSEYIVYSDNPFAYQLINFLKTKGAKIYFDAMDNFAIHPSLNNIEQDVAFKGYGTILQIADCYSANSEQTCKYIKKYFGKEIILVKNGVFSDNHSNVGVDNLKLYQKLIYRKNKYKNTIGYIGKIGQRIDADLVEKISLNCTETLFIFVGPCLKGQINKRLLRLFKKIPNVIHLDGIPSAYVLDMLEQFDILAIPHAVGKAENGGDPLKLYQYLTRNKPIITTDILGVKEFLDLIFISNDASDWIKYINSNPTSNYKCDIKRFEWKSRFLPIKNIIEEW